MPGPDDGNGDASGQAEGQPADSADTAPVADTLVCGAGLTDCNGTCADLASDPANCGMCGLSCGVDLCIDGLCMAQESPPPADVPAEIPADVAVEEAPPLIEDCAAQGLTDCGGACIDIFSDPFNCGGCGLICLDGQTCSGGTCA
ncbi:MAG: hypothetical protein JNM64_11585 [Chloroflexia bacterium]|nr:hypothetical protein [Chloroflexia bacterium]